MCRRLAARKSSDSLAHSFFALAPEEKDEISQLKSPQFRGYSRLGGELTIGEVDWREQIDIGPERPVIDDAEGYWNLQGPNLYLRATRHRVLAPEAGADRVSIPFFLSPALDAVIPIVSLPEELAANSKGVEADPDNSIFDTYGANAWKSRTRAHPDVAELHHGIVQAAHL